MQRPCPRAFQAALRLSLHDAELRTIADRLAAVEVAAGNALFHVVVDDDATAARLMKRLQGDELGRPPAGRGSREAAPSDPPP